MTDAADESAQACIDDKCDCRFCASGAPNDAESQRARQQCGCKKVWLDKKIVVEIPDLETREVIGFSKIIDTPSFYAKYYAPEVERVHEPTLEEWNKFKREKEEFNIAPTPPVDEPAPQ